MRLRSILPLLVVAGGCNDSNPMPTPTPTELTCVELRDALQDLIETSSRACATRSDCAAVGYALDTFGGATCNGGIPFAYHCYGAPVNGAAWSADAMATNLQREWHERCVPLGLSSGVDVWYDCGVGPVDCVDDVCTIMAYDCFSFDAGVH